MATPKASREQWILRGRTISKRYNLFGHGNRWSGQTAQLEIEFKPSRITRILEPAFTITVKPSPLTDWEDGHLDAHAVFADEPDEPFLVMLVEIENTADRALNITSTLAKDAEAVVDRLCFGRDIVLVVADGDERLLELPIPNDHSVYDLIRKAML
ncbi:MAG: hypothetical protein OER56_00895 [Hyphomicrobiales bacterium]|nr:hypothetical protein [Hyphomicrobiales bacterium]